MRLICLWLSLGLLLATAHRLPAPISEVATPTPTPTSVSTTPAKAPIAPAANVPSPTSKAKTGRFAGTWTGIVPFKDPFVGGGGNQQCDFVINAEETSMIIRVSKPNGGAHHTATTRIVVIGNTASAKGGFLKHMSTTLTLTGDGSTGSVVVHDTIWGTTSGTVKRIK
jgi:hypothetical protein